MMRVAKQEGELSLHLISGPHVVLLAMNWPKGRRKELMGFAIYRTNLTTGSGDWLYGMKHFAGMGGNTNEGERYSTRLAPVQSFWWGDYSVEPGQSYRYRVLALQGAPGALTELAAVEADVDCPTITPSGHEIRFNRGAVAAQEYARRFQNSHPESWPNGEALAWLTRGLLDSTRAFIQRADGKKTTLHVAIYEARYRPILEELKKARGRGAKVHILFDAKENGDANEEAFPREENLRELEAAGLLVTDCTARDANPSYIAHNKFMVLSRNGKPAAVWTGSTNWSLNGFMGQLNAAHVINDPAVARKYLDCWKLLAGDPEAKTLRPKLEALSQPAPNAPSDQPRPSFSPQRTRAALDDYVAAVGGARAVMVTFAFSIDKEFVTALKTDDEAALRYVLMDGIKGNEQQYKATKAAVRAMRKAEATQVAIGAYVRENALDNWIVETSNMMATHVAFVHTKFMLVDPLGASPIVITGSANFSEGSCRENDENMLVISGDPDVADVYLGEFTRCYAHYAFRDARETARRENRPFEVKPLAKTPAWNLPYYSPGFKRRQREYFAAP